MAGAEQSIDIDATPQVVFDIIIKYEDYPTFLDDVSKCVVLSRADGKVRIEQTLSLVKEVTMTLAITEVPCKSVTWVTEGGSRFLKKNDGSWTLEDLGGGRTRATYGLDVEVGMWVPKKIIDKMTGSTLPKTLEAFKKRAEAVAKAS